EQDMALVSFYLTSRGCACPVLFPKLYKVELRDDGKIDQFRRVKGSENAENLKTINVVISVKQWRYRETESKSHPVIEMLSSTMVDHFLKLLDELVTES